MITINTLGVVVVLITLLLGILEALNLRRLTDDEILG